MVKYEQQDDETALVETESKYVNITANIFICSTFHSRFRGPISGSYYRFNEFF